MDSLVHNELVIVRHTLATLRKELEFVRMAIRDLGVDEVDYELLRLNGDLTSVGLLIKVQEKKLLEKL